MLVSLIAQKASSTSCIKQRVERKNEKKNIKIIFFPEVETEMAKTAQRFHVFFSTLEKQVEQWKWKNFDCLEEV